MKKDISYVFCRMNYRPTDSINYILDTHWEKNLYQNFSRPSRIAAEVHVSPIASVLASVLKLEIQAD